MTSREMQMAPWKINYWAIHQSAEVSIEEILNNLTTEQIKSIAKEVKLLEICGNSLKLPHSKSLGKGLFELRERRYGYRIYYTFSANQNITMLHVGKKSSQVKDIRISRNRLAEFLRGVEDEN